MGDGEKPSVTGASSAALRTAYLAAAQVLGDQQMGLRNGEFFFETK